MRFLNVQKKVKRMVALAIMGTVCVCAAFAQAPVDLDAAIAQAGGDLSGKSKPVGLVTSPRVALLNFSSSANDLSAYVLRETALVLERGRNTAVIARAEIDRAMSQARLSITGEVSDAAARQIGRTLTAQYVVTGSFEKAGNDYRFRTRFITINDNSSPVTLTIMVRETPQLRQLLGIADPAPAAINPGGTRPSAVPAQPVPAAPAVTLANGTYTLMPRPQGRKEGIWEDIYVSRVVVDSEYITFFFENTETGGRGSAGLGTGRWDRGQATLSDLDKPTVYQTNTGRTTASSGNTSSCVFPRIDAKRVKLETRDKLVIAEIILGEPD